MTSHSSEKPPTIIDSEKTREPLLAVLEAQGFEIKTQDADPDDTEALRAYGMPGKYIATKEFTHDGQKKVVTIVFAPWEQGTRHVFSAVFSINGVEKATNNDFNEGEFIANVFNVCVMAEFDVDWSEISGNKQARERLQQLKYDQT